MAEYIEREKAIELIQPHVKPQTVYGEGYLQAIEHATDILTLLPSADVQPVKHGRWIDVYEWAKMHDSIPSGVCLYYWCSECQEEQEKKSDFCPNCGARMIKEGETNG